MAYAQYLPLSAIAYSYSMSASLSIYPPILACPARCLCNVHLRFISVRPCRAYPPDMASDFRFALQRTRNQLSLRLTACPTYPPVALSTFYLATPLPLPISQPGVTCLTWVSELWHLRGLRSESFRFRLWLQSWLPQPTSPCIVLPVWTLQPILRWHWTNLRASLSHSCVSSFVQRLCHLFLAFQFATFNSLIPFILNFPIVCNLRSLLCCIPNKVLRSPLGFLDWVLFNGNKTE